MLFIKNWNKASLDKSSNSIVTRYKSKISSLTDKTEALRKLLEELYDEAVILNERIKIDKQAIQEDLNDTAEDLRTTCGNSSWGQEEIERAQDLLDRAEEDIDDIKTDIEITTGCLVVCQSGQGAGCNQPTIPCNENTCLVGDAPCNETPEEEEPEEDTCVVIVNGEFECTGSDSYIDNCYGGCFSTQSCDSNTKVCPKCHGSDVDIVETCTECDTDQKTTCGTFDDQAGCDTDNNDGNCDSENSTGDCEENNSTGNCIYYNNNGDCAYINKNGTCREDVTGDCDTTNEAKVPEEDNLCGTFNKEGTDCKRWNSEGDCVESNFNGDCSRNNDLGDCVGENIKGTCQTNDSNRYCDTKNSDNETTCGRNDNNAENCNSENNNGDCNTENNNGDCDTENNAGLCRAGNKSGDCYELNDTGNCITNNVNEDGEAVGECATQSCEAGQECTTCIEDQKESTTTEKCEAGANIGEEEYCDTCQGDESKVEEWDQEELEDLCGPIFEGGADACGPSFADCFNATECDGASFGAAAGCGTTQGCGTCNENDTCSGGQECATGQTCTNNDCGQDCSQPCGQCGTCVSGEGPCNQTCYPVYTIPGGGGECRLGYNPGCGEGVVCPGGTYNGECGQWGGEDI